MIQAKGWRVNNVDVTIIAQAPKLAAFIPQMQALVAEDLQVAADAAVSYTHLDVYKRQSDHRHQRIRQGAGRRHCPGQPGTAGGRTGDR